MEDKISFKDRGRIQGSELTGQYYWGTLCIKKSQTWKEGGNSNPNLAQ